MMRFRAIILISLAIAFTACSPKPSGEQTWVSLFKGHDLDGWIVKIKGYPVGENYAQTFRVADGVMVVTYDTPAAYELFDDRFGHIFYEVPYSNYRFRLEYRFTGEQVPGGPDWALRNSGIMVHSQSPYTMLLEQEFPVSIEVQLLGGANDGARPTGNLCTPGTNVVIDRQLITRHCTESSSQTYDGDQWVSAEVEVRGGKVIRHLINGEIVLEYEEPQLDPEDAAAEPFLDRDSLLLTNGYISLQSESHPIEFRKIEIFDLGQH